MFRTEKKGITITEQTPKSVIFNGEHFKSVREFATRYHIYEYKKYKNLCCFLNRNFSLKHNTYNLDNEETKPKIKRYLNHKKNKTGYQIRFKKQLFSSFSSLADELGVSRYIIQYRIVKDKNYNKEDNIISFSKEQEKEILSFAKKYKKNKERGFQKIFVFNGTKWSSERKMAHFLKINDASLNCFIKRNLNLENNYFDLCNPSNKVLLDYCRKHNDDYFFYTEEEKIRMMCDNDTSLFKKCKYYLDQHKNEPFKSVLKKFNSFNNFSKSILA